MNLKPFTPRVSVGIGAWAIFVSGFMLLTAHFRHRPLSCVAFAMSILLLVYGAGVLLREWRRHRGTLAKA